MLDFLPSQDQGAEPFICQRETVFKLKHRLNEPQKKEYIPASLCQKQNNHFLLVYIMGREE